MPHDGDLSTLLSLLRQHQPALRRRYQVRSLAIFGSVVRGSSTATSDIDLLIEFDGEPPGLLRFLELEQHLADVLGAKVDLVMATALKPRLRKRILEEAVAA